MAIFLSQKNKLNQLINSEGKYIHISIQEDILQSTNESSPTYIFQRL